MTSIWSASIWGASWRAALTALVLFLTAPAGAQPSPPPPLPDAPSALGEGSLEAWLVLFDSVGDAVRPVAHDCAALAQAIDGWLAEHGAAFVAASAALAAAPPELDDDPALHDAVERRLSRTLEALTEATLSCAEHDEASAALERLRLTTAGPP